MSSNKPKNPLTLEEYLGRGNVQSFADWLGKPLSTVRRQFEYMKKPMIDSSRTYKKKLMQEEELVRKEVEEMQMEVERQKQ
jgi:hypothetical protein